MRHVNMGIIPYVARVAIAQSAHLAVCPRDTQRDHEGLRNVIADNVALVA